MPAQGLAGGLAEGLQLQLALPRVQLGVGHHHEGQVKIVQLQRCPAWP